MSEAKNKIAVRELIRAKIREGLKSSKIVELGYDSEVVREVKAEENNLRDKNLRQQEKDDQSRSQEAKRERQYRQMMIDLGQDPDNVQQNIETGTESTVIAPAVGAAIATGDQTQGDLLNTQ